MQRRLQVLLCSSCIKCSLRMCKICASMFSKVRNSIGNDTGPCQSISLICSWSYAGVETSNADLHVCRSSDPITGTIKLWRRCSTFYLSAHSSFTGTVTFPTRKCLYPGLITLKIILGPYKSQQFGGFFFFFSFIIVKVRGHYIRGNEIKLMFCRSTVEQKHN